VRRCLRDPTFSRFDTIPECDRHIHTHRHMTTAYTVLSKASRGKNGVEYRNMDKQVNSANDASASCTNMVNFGPEIEV